MFTHSHSKYVDQVTFIIPFAGLYTVLSDALYNQDGDETSVLRIKPLWEHVIVG
jgi:hypothetical protein